MNMEEVSFGKVLKYYRTNLSLTQEELAEGICSRKYISKLEKDIQIPTLDIVNKLSNKLEINIYDTYALILRHHNIETHLLIENLNNNFSHSCLKNLKPLIDDYSQLEAFKTGEPFQILAYAQCLYYGTYEMNHNKAIVIAESALAQFYPNFMTPLFNPLTLSNSELTLFLSLAVNYCRAKKFDSASMIYNFTLNYLRKVLQQSHYVINKNHHFEMNLYGLVLFNCFITFRQDGQFFEDEIDFILDLLKATDNSFNLTKLLFMKAYICNVKNDKHSYNHFYNIAHHYGLFIYNEQELYSLEKEILQSE